MQAFVDRLKLGAGELLRRPIGVLQVNLGRYCNLACIHCHVEAGPTRTEMMSRDNVEAVLRFLNATKIPTLDITGGAPELHEDFDDLVVSACGLGRHVIDRCNLTVIFQPGKDYLPEFFCRHRVELACSLPCYSIENVDKQRGKGTFDESIRALRILNELGYGKPESGLKLNLVYNPIGPHLPPAQDELERDYKRVLGQEFGIEFNQLFCITNMPITRYATHLKLRREFDSYMQLLQNSFNASTLDHVMCRDLISVGWDGRIYDCDFNQMLGFAIVDADREPLHISRLTLEQLSVPIIVADHCYACTAGAGSSCGGSLI